MTDTHIRYVELFVTAVKTSSFNDPFESEEDSEDGKKKVFNHTPALFIDYLSLHESTDDLIRRVQSDLEGIDRVKFHKEIGADALSKAQERKVKALYQTIDRIKPQRKKTIPHAVVHSDKPLGKVYSFYTIKRAHKYESDVILFELSEGEALRISNMLQMIGKDYLRLQVLEEIELHLEFNEFYSAGSKQIVGTAADACHRIRQQLNANNQTITKEQLLQRVLNEYHIKRYAHASSGEKEKLMKKAVYQWTRDNKVGCITN